MQIQLKQNFPTLEIYTVGATIATGVKIKVFNVSLNKMIELQVFDNGDIKIIGSEQYYGNNEQV